MMEASAMTTEMVVAAITDTITAQAIKLWYSNLLQRKYNSKNSLSSKSWGRQVRLKSATVIHYCYYYISSGSDYKSFLVYVNITRATK